MATPSKTAYESASATILAADAVMIQAAAGAFQPVIDANNAAIAALDAALGTYSPPPGLSAAADRIRGWRNQLAAFAPTYDALNTQAAAMLPASEEAAPAA